jgi:hypothetical protein
MRVAGLMAIEAVPNCDELYAAQAAIQTLITENCPIAKPTPEAK